MSRLSHALGPNSAEAMHVHLPELAPSLVDSLEPVPLPEHDDHLWSIGALLPVVLARYDIQFDPDGGAPSSNPRLTDCTCCR